MTGRPTYPADHVCEAPGCSNPSPTARCCGNACRAKVWKIEHKYRDRRRSVRNARERRQTKREIRYAILTREGLDAFTVVGETTAPSKRAAERAAGITDEADTFAIAASHLPERTA